MLPHFVIHLGATPSREWLLTGVALHLHLVFPQVTTSPQRRCGHSMASCLLPPSYRQPEPLLMRPPISAAQQGRPLGLLGEAEDRDGGHGAQRSLRTHRSCGDSKPHQPSCCTTLGRPAEHRGRLLRMAGVADADSRGQGAVKVSHYYAVGGNRRKVEGEAASF